MISGFRRICVRELARYHFDPPTALEFVSITWSSTGVCFFVSETISSSFSGSFWTQLVDKKFAEPDLIITLAFVSVILSFQGMSRGHQEKHPHDIVRNQPAEPAVHHALRHTWDQSGRLGADNWAFPSGTRTRVGEQ